MRKLPFLAALTALAVTACGGDNDRLKDAVSTIGVVPLGTDLAFVQSNDTVQRLGVTGGSLRSETSKLTVRAKPRSVAKRPSTTGIEEILVTSEGTSDPYGQVLTAPALTAISAAGALREYDLVSPGQQMRVDDEGRFAILFNDPTYKSASESLLVNPAEVAIVDLTAPAALSQNPVIRNIDTVGGAPIGVRFPKLTVGTSVHEFALFAFPKGISLIDLATPTEAGHKLDLSPWLGTGQTLSASSLSMVADPQSNEIFLTQPGVKYVLAVAVSPRADGSAGVDVSQKQLTIGSNTPDAMAVYSTDAGSQLVVAMGSSVSVVDTDEDTVTSVALSYRADSIIMFTGASPADSTAKQRALLFGTQQSAVTFVDLESLAKNQSRALQTVEFGGSINRIQQLPFMQNRVLVFLQSGGVDVLDLTTRRWLPVQSPIALSLMAADPERNRVWVSATNDDRLGCLDFGDGVSQSALSIKHQVTLDDPVQSFFRMGTGVNAKVVAVHAKPGGAVTVVDAVNPERSTASKLEGFLFSNLL